jgi:aspartyl-tRNA(Asn)/glutamyl-tRNA(Gln) amidotransferase subunit A
MTTTSVERLDVTLAALAALNAQGDEAGRIFTRLYADEAYEAAGSADDRARRGHGLGPLDGRLVSIKDLFDVAGEPTTAGSVLLRDAAPAARDAVVVRRLRAAGAVVVGKTNMSEFAFSGVGLNPHYGTPGNAHDGTRIPGGSSSGAALSVALGLVEIAIGSDTGGSVRIPAAFNGLVGFKPTQARITRDGAFPLSYTLDTLGPLCRSVADAAATDSVLAGIEHALLPQRSVNGLRLGVPRGLLFSQADAEVLAAVDQALARLAAAGARVSDESLDDWLAQPFLLQERGTLVAAEAVHVHRAWIDARADAYDPIVLARIRRGMTIDAATYVGILQARAALMGTLDQRLAEFDALLLPTVPVLPPPIEQLQSEEGFLRHNALVLRNPSVFNFFDLPALSLPLHAHGPLPIGLMVVGQRGRDRELLAIGAAIEAVMGHGG